MNGPGPTRREFVSATAGGLGSGWLWLHLPVIASLSACAREAARTEEPFALFSVAEGQAMRAFAVRVIPTEVGSPGAEEAGAAWFADSALAGPFPELAGPVRKGLAELDARSRAAHGQVFARLDTARQDAILGDMVETTFFEYARMLVVMGTFSDPVHGGNRGHAGFTLRQFPESDDSPFSCRRRRAWPDSTPGVRQGAALPRPTNCTCPRLTQRATTHWRAE
jgi:gluconate 2-dehydrogenase gamma chain